MLSDIEVKAFERDGFLLRNALLTIQEVNILKQEIEPILLEDSPRKILEKNGVVRSVFAPHLSSAAFDKICSLKRLLTPAQQLLKGQVYIHQTKLNLKQALYGDWWEWHQDFPYWHLEDGMPSPRVVTAMIFLDDVNEFNGPLCLIPGSHKAGIVDSNANSLNEADDSWFNEYQKSTPYMSSLTAGLKYTLKGATIEKWVANSNIYSAKGCAGSVLFFDGLVFHASSNNLSPWNRFTYLITYNSVDNKLLPVDNQRPDFLANRNFKPLVAIESDELF